MLRYGQFHRLPAHGNCRVRIREWVYHWHPALHSESNPLPPSSAMKFNIGRGLPHEDSMAMQTAHRLTSPSACHRHACHNQRFVREQNVTKCRVDDWYDNNLLRIHSGLSAALRFSSKLRTAGSSTSGHANLRQRMRHNRTRLIGGGQYVTDPAAVACTASNAVASSVGCWRSQLRG